MLQLRRTMMLAATALLLGGCRDSSPTEPPVGSRVSVPEVVSGDAVVRYMDFEGGFYAIVASDRGFDPSNLPAEFRRDGLAVRFAGRTRPDLMTTHMSGIVIDLSHIERR